MKHAHTHICRRTITRVYTTPAETAKSPKPNRKRWEPILARRFGERLLMFDYESWVEPGQRASFGSFQVREGSDLVDEGLILGDHVPRRYRRVVERYAVKNKLHIY